MLITNSICYILATDDRTVLRNMIKSLQVQSHRYWSMIALDMTSEGRLIQTVESAHDQRVRYVNSRSDGIDANNYPQLAALAGSNDVVCALKEGDFPLSHHAYTVCEAMAYNPAMDVVLCWSQTVKGHLSTQVPITMQSPKDLSQLAIRRSKLLSIDDGELYQHYIMRLMGNGRYFCVPNITLICQHNIEILWNPDLKI